MATVVNTFPDERVQAFIDAIEKSREEARMERLAREDREFQTTREDESAVASRDLYSALAGAKTREEQLAALGQANPAAFRGDNASILSETLGFGGQATTTAEGDANRGMTKYTVDTTEAGQDRRQSSMQQWQSRERGQDRELEKLLQDQRIEMQRFGITTNRNTALDVASMDNDTKVKIQELAGYQAQTLEQLRIASNEGMADEERRLRRDLAEMEAETEQLLEKGRNKRATQGFQNNLDVVDLQGRNSFTLAEAQNTAAMDRLMQQLASDEKLTNVREGGALSRLMLGLENERELTRIRQEGAIGLQELVGSQALDQIVTQGTVDREKLYQRFTNDSKLLEIRNKHESKLAEQSNALREVLQQRELAFAANDRVAAAEINDAFERMRQRFNNSRLMYELEAKERMHELSIDSTESIAAGDQATRMGIAAMNAAQVEQQYRDTMAFERERFAAQTDQFQQTLDAKLQQLGVSQAQFEAGLENDTMRTILDINSRVLIADKNNASAMEVAALRYSQEGATAALDLLKTTGPTSTRVATLAAQHMEKNGGQITSQDYTKIVLQGGSLQAADNFVYSLAKSSLGDQGILEPDAKGAVAAASLLTEKMVLNEYITPDAAKAQAAGTFAYNYATSQSVGGIDMGMDRKREMFQQTTGQNFDTVRKLHHAVLFRPGSNSRKNAEKMVIGQIASFVVPPTGRPGSDDYQPGGEVKLIRNNATSWSPVFENLVAEPGFLQ